MSRLTEPADDAETPPFADASASSSADPTDSALASAARAGDRAAADALVRRHYEGIRKLLWRFTRSPSDLEDLVQDTFVRMLRGLPGWREDRPFSHWLRRIATNTGRDYCRRSTVRRRVMSEPLVDEEGNTIEPTAVDRAPDPAARAASEEMKQMLEQLSADDRTVLTLHHLEGWSMAEIADSLGWTVTATKLRAWRARSRLRQLLESAPATSSESP